MFLVSAFDPCFFIPCHKPSKCVSTGHPNKGNGSWSAHCECDGYHKGDLCESKFQRVPYSVAYLEGGEHWVMVPFWLTFYRIFPLRRYKGDYICPPPLAPRPLPPCPLPGLPPYKILDRPLTKLSSHERLDV